jgi:hypothetical protein
MEKGYGDLEKVEQLVNMKECTTKIRNMALEFSYGQVGISIKAPIVKMKDMDLVK